MATAKKPETTDAEEKYPMGTAIPYAEDPTAHIEEWPEAYDPPPADVVAPTTDSGGSSSSSASS